MTFKTGDAYSETVFVGHDCTHAFIGVATACSNL